MSLSPAHQNAVSQSFVGLPARLQQQPFRFLLLAGLGTGSLFVVHRLTPSLWNLFTTSRSGGADAPASTPTPSHKETSKSTQGRSSKSHAKEEAESVAIFWDVDNCAPPTGSSGRMVAQAIRASMQNLELGPIVSFKAYLELSSETLAPNAQQVQLRSELQGSGVSLIDTPKSGRKDVADKMMITDLLAFAIDQPAPATIVLISGDRDFAYPLGLLRNRGYEIVLITPPVGAVPILEASANVVLTWRQDVLGVERASNGRLYSSMNGASTPSKSHSSTQASSQHGFHSATASAQNYSNVSQGRPSNVASRSTRRPSVQSTEVFQPLIDLLGQLKSEGNSKPLRAAVAARLISSDRSIYVRAGASRWAEYAAVAEAAGIITLGTSGPPGTEWVSLSDGPSPPVASSLGKPATLQTLSQSSPIPSRAKPVPATPSPATDPSATVDMRAFYPLIEICKEQKAQGNRRPLASYVGTQLTIMARQGIVDVYALAGVPSWREYISLAERVGIARLGSSSQDGVNVVELHPKYLYAQTTQVTPSAGRIVDTATTPTFGVEKKSSGAKKALLNGFMALSRSPSKDAPSPTGKTVFNGHEIPAKFSHLAQILLEQMSEGRNYSTDYFLHSILGSSRSGNGLRLKNADEFQAFLEEAIAERIVTTEAGFKPGVKHVRLHNRFMSPGGHLGTDTEGSSSSDNSEGDDRTLGGRDTLMSPLSSGNGSKAQSNSISHSISNNNNTSIGDSSNSTSTSSEVKEKEMLDKQKKTKEVLDQLKTSTTIEGVRTSSGPVPPNNRMRFQILIDVVAELRSAKNGGPAAKAQVSSELVKRNPGPGGMGAFYQALGSTGFTDFVDQARLAGFVVVVDREGREVVGSEWKAESEYGIALSSRYESTVFS